MSASKGLSPGAAAIGAAAIGAAAIGTAAMGTAAGGTSDGDALPNKTEADMNRARHMAEV